VSYREVGGGLQMFRHFARQPATFARRL
jgi:hypothetical protein